MSGNGAATVQSAAAKVSTPPHDDASERALLGAILLGPEALGAAVEAGVTPADFYAPARGAVFARMLALAEERTPIDVVTVASGLEAAGHLGAVGGIAGLSRLLDDTLTVAHAAGYAATVRALARMRAVIATCRAVAAVGTVGDREPDEFVAAAVRDVLDAARDDRTTSYVHVARALDEAYARVQEASNRPEHVAGIATGLRRLDNLLGGLQKSDLVVVAGRPGSGKTSWSIQVAADAAARHGSRVLIFSMEMSYVALGHRMLSRASGIEGITLKHGIPKSEGTAPWDAIHGTMQKLREYTIWISDDAMLSAQKIAAKARRLVSEQGAVDLVVVDYVQLMASERRAESRAQEVAANVHALKALAKELDASLIALSQLSRRVEQRSEDARPRLSDLKESGAFEEDADVVLFLHPDADHGHARADGYVVEAIVAKHRNGPTGTVNMHFTPKLTRFEDLAEEEA